SGPLSFNLGMLRFDGSELRVTVNYRYPVTRAYDDCVPQVRAAFGQAGFRLAASSHSEKLFVPEDAPLVRKLLGVYNAYTGQNARPLCIGGGTYAKSMPNILAFGPCFPGEEPTEHQPDEYIDLGRLRQCYDMTRLAILALSE
ncbi:MAG: M20/M25/M40 family metallo-hydrolase, partial [Desulfovibrio sp.]|nr:M20/M25/M40 family metallo-hydrolase [Desulfovibrio sp.]